MLRPLIINGFMASGKSAAAQLVAERTGRPWVDIDQLVAERAGQSIQDLFRERGEGYFRDLERAALEEALAAPRAAVISVGGGALLQRTLRLKAMAAGVVVCLVAGAETLSKRLSGDDSMRPLLAGANPEDIKRLLELRAPAYAEAHEHIAVDSLTKEQVAERLIAIWKRDPIGVAAGLSSYSVEVLRGSFGQRLAESVRGATLGLLITDSNVEPLYGGHARRALEDAQVPAASFVFTPGEAEKNPSTLERIWARALEVGADRKSRFVGLGGGVATDIAGFAAATWMRGVPWVSCPTTLLAMVDASVGGKTAVDLPNAKNCVGAFWQPCRVLCDVSHLKTEPERGYRSALAEVVKTALLGDADLLDTLEQEREAIMARSEELTEHIVRRCIAVKADVVSKDEREGGLRAALNLGHTFGHALEAYGGYGELTHGEAVSLGLVAALKLGARIGCGSAELTERVRRLLSYFGLPTDLTRYPLSAAAALIANDKKRSGTSVRFVLTPEPGQVEFRSLTLAEVRDHATWLSSS